MRYRPLGDPTRHLQAIITLVSRCKDENISPDDYCAVRGAAAGRGGGRAATTRTGAIALESQVELAATYAKYQELMAREGNIDFGDQIVLALRLLRERPHVLNRLSAALQVHPGGRVPGHELRAVRAGEAAGRPSPQRGASSPTTTRPSIGGAAPPSPTCWAFSTTMPGPGRSSSPRTSARTRPCSTPPTGSSSTTTPTGSKSAAGS